MKKKVLLLISIIALSIICFSLSACSNKQISDECVRIHIRANSNLDNDQEVKLKVRDEVTAYLTSRLENARTKDEALGLIGASMNELQEVAQSTLCQNGYDYSATVRLSREEFPTRSYGGYTFPDGDYDALIIELGSGTGDNWWCVAFPPLCFVPDGGDQIEYHSWVYDKLKEIFSK